MNYFLTLLPSGNYAVYDVQAHQLIDRPRSTLNERAYMYGAQIAVRFPDGWRKSGAFEPITDARTIQLLESCPKAWE